MEQKHEEWEGKAYSFFCHKTCEYFPCHEGIDPEEFNCLFCYCPLYFLGERCGGRFEYTKKGVKNCVHCTVPHRKENYGRIMAILKANLHRAGKEQK